VISTHGRDFEAMTAGLAHQLLRAFAKADLRMPGVRWLSVDIQHIFYVIRELGIGLGTDAPLLLQPGLQFAVL